MAGNKVTYSQSSAELLGPIARFWASSADIFNPILKWNPIYRYLTTSSGQYGLINIRHGESSNPAVEQEVVEDVAGYGRQLGRLLDAVAVLALHLGKEYPQIAEDKKIRDLLLLCLQIEDRKEAISNRNIKPIKVVDDASSTEEFKQSLDKFLIAPAARPSRRKH